MSSIPYGMNVNTLTVEDMEAVPCPICGAEGQCVDLHTPMHCKRNDYHSERKYAALVEKQQKREMIRQQTVEVENAQVQVQEAEAALPAVEMSSDLAEDPGPEVRGVSGEDGSTLPVPDEQGGEYPDGTMMVGYKSEEPDAGVQ